MSGTHNDSKYFWFAPMVARLWSSFAVLESVLAKETKGPWEVTLALAGTRDSLLAGFAQGWAEPNHGFHDALACRSANVLFRLEAPQWPPGEDVCELAFRLGGLIENAWGYPLKRFLSRDTSEFGWGSVP